MLLATAARRAQEMPHQAPASSADSGAPASVVEDRKRKTVILGVVGRRGVDPELAAVLADVCGLLGGVRRNERAELRARRADAVVARRFVHGGGMSGVSLCNSPTTVIIRCVRPFGSARVIS